MTAAIAVHGLTRSYGRGLPPALDALCFEVPRGALCGLIGPNGAGKTTLFSVLCGLLAPDQGRVDLLGLGPFKAGVHTGRVGVLPQDADLADRLTCRDLLVYLARLQGLTAAAARAAAADALGRVNLADRADRLTGTLSHGMRRRLATASALVGAPELVLLDEPTAGLDPVEAHRLREVVAGLRGRATVVISSHNLVELERLCDHIVLLDAGRCVYAGPLDGVTQRDRSTTWWTGPGAVPLEALRQALPTHALSAEPAADGWRLDHRAPAEASLDEAAFVIQERLTGAGLALRGLHRGSSLEEAFLAGRPPGA